MKSFFFYKKKNVKAFVMKSSHAIIKFRNDDNEYTGETKNQAVKWLCCLAFFRYDTCLERFSCAGRKYFWLVTFTDFLSCYDQYNGLFCREHSNWDHVQENLFCQYFKDDRDHAFGWLFFWQALCNQGVRSSCFTFLMEF